LHFNDNYSEWDWDVIPKTFRFWEHLELIFWLRQLGYNKWYSIDITMPRGDAIQICQQSVVNIQRLCRLMGKLDRDQILANLHRMTIRRICGYQIRCLRHWALGYAPALVSER
jgi:xylose isomerase